MCIEVTEGSEFGPKFAEGVWVCFVVKYVAGRAASVSLQFLLVGIMSWMRQC